MCRKPKAKATVLTLVFTCILSGTCYATGWLYGIPIEPLGRSWFDWVFVGTCVFGLVILVLMGVQKFRRYRLPAAIIILCSLFAAVVPGYVVFSNYGYGLRNNWIPYQCIRCAAIHAHKSEPGDGNARLRVRCDVTKSAYELLSEYPAIEECVITDIVGVGTVKCVLFSDKPAENGKSLVVHIEKTDLCDVVGASEYY
jgi:hypothetical protein